MAAWGRTMPMARVAGEAAIGVIAGIVNAVAGGLGALLIAAERRDGANARQGRKRGM